MKPIRIYTLTLLAAAALAACSSVPTSNAMLDQARGDYRSAQADPQMQVLAPAELKQAGDALAQADAAFDKHEDPSRVNQLAYLARQRVALAREVAGRKDAEAVVAESSATRDQLRLAARTREADAATHDAKVSMHEAMASKHESETAQREAAASQQQAATSAQQTAAAQQKAGDAELRSQALEAQLRELNAKKTDRGMVITIGDVLFDSGQSQLKSGGMQNMQRLSGFLKEYPQRKALIEGYTDSTGSDSQNMALSGRRAEAVRTTLLGMGVGNGQIAAQGYGQTHPVAGNDSSGGRQMNRRVEIVLSDENGVMTTR